jgi:hypothetical protein
MIGEGQDIATGTVSPPPHWDLYNLLHLPSRTTCPIPSKRQSFLSPRSQEAQRCLETARDGASVDSLPEESNLLQKYPQFKSIGCKAPI